MMLVLCKCGWEVEVAEGSGPRRCAVCNNLLSPPPFENPEATADAILSEHEPATQNDDKPTELTDDDEVAASTEEKPARPRRRRRNTPRKKSWLSKFEGLQIPTPIDLIGSAFLFTLGGIIIGFRLANSGKFSYLGLAILLFGFVRLFRIASLKKD